MSHLLRNLLIALGFTILVGVVYTVFLGGDESTEDEEVEMVGEKPEVLLKTEKILADIREIQSYDIDSSLFEDQRFTSLTSYRVRIQDVATGRANPFDPVR